MRISDWSSDVCSSDLCCGEPAETLVQVVRGKQLLRHGVLLHKRRMNRLTGSSMDSRPLGNTNTMAIQNKPMKRGHTIVSMLEIRSCSHQTTKAPMNGPIRVATQPTATHMMTTVESRSTITSGAT